MKTKIQCLFILWAFSAAAQVGIGTTDPKAILDIKSTNQANPSSTDGMLVPKIDTFPATDPSIDQQGMLVYLTTAVGTDQPGFYYWDNPTSVWIPIGNNSNSGWNLNGNAGTDDTVNFIGTRDNEDIVFKRNNVKAGRIGLSNLSLGTNSALNSSGINNVFLGTEAGSAHATGDANVYIGRRAGFSGTSGANNVLIGNGAGFFNTASSNVFVGGFSGNATTSGSFNAFLGISSGSTTSTGIGNTFIGGNAGQGNTVGSFNTSLGRLSKPAVNNLTNATAIGAMAEVGSNNSMVLGSINGVNGATSNVNVGIGTTTPSRRLHVMNTGTSGGAPFGTAGFVLESNAQVYQQFLTPSNRESGLLFGNEISNIRAGILYNSGNPDGLSFRTGGNNTRMAITNAGDVGVGTITPQAALDITSNDTGVMVPRVTLTAANVQAPVVNPSGGALPNSTLVYNTSSSGTVPNDVTPGFYYWDNNRWNRLGNENKTRYYTAIGTTNAQYPAGVGLTQVPEMSITFVPTGNSVIVNFSASGRLVAQNLLSQANVESLPVGFRIHVNNTFVRTFSTMTNSVSSVDPSGVWDINFQFPVAVTPGISQTVTILYEPMSVPPFNAADGLQSFVALPPQTFFGVLTQHHRVLTVIDP
ncbi:MAG: hypothetical protein R2783_09705 [Gelidibacter sp.]